MAKRMLIDVAHSEETRVAVLKGNRLEDFDFESATKKQLKGNIYLAKVTRVEPSLQAAFVDYGGNRHGFLAFNEIHADYYRIPIADREALLEQEKALAERSAESNGGERGEGEDVETIGGDDMEEVAPRRFRSPRPYKIQEVIKRRQIMLVQVVKEERGNKGAALTTYLSLAGRYCVLMPNTPRGGGVSRKITNLKDRRRLKSILEEFEVPEGMSVIVRTAGMERSKTEIKRDLEYLMRLWDEIRTLTLQSTAPALIYEEANLIKRAIRDLYDRDIDEIQVEGDDGYRAAKDFMRMLTPSHAKRVHLYKDDMIPLFHRYQVESQIDAIHSPVVHLKSGGYIVITPTEALVSIDVNSGRATKERNIEETALRTNLEAAEEIARQLRLRDLAGLIVIDFIDMEEPRNNAAVERRVKEAMRLDRARIQIGRISAFGLLELSRQRLRPSLVEATMQHCATCGGSGWVRSTESSALHVLRALEEEGIRQRSTELQLTVPSVVALYVLNQKRAVLTQIEQRYRFSVTLDTDDSLVPPAYRLERIRVLGAEPQPAAPISHDAAMPPPAEAEAPSLTEEQPALPAAVDGEEEEEEATTTEVRSGAPRALEERPAGEPGEGPRRRRHRRRRRRRGPGEEAQLPGAIALGAQGGAIPSTGSGRTEHAGAGEFEAEVAISDQIGPEETSSDELKGEEFGAEESQEPPFAAVAEGERRRRGRRGGRRRRRSGEATTERMAGAPPEPGTGGMGGGGVGAEAAETQPEQHLAPQELGDAFEPVIPSWDAEVRPSEEPSEPHRQHRRSRRHDAGAASAATAAPAAEGGAPEAASGMPAAGAESDLGIPVPEPSPAHEPSPRGPTPTFAEQPAGPTGAAPSVSVPTEAEAPAAPSIPVITVGAHEDDEDRHPKKRGWWRRLTE